VATEIMMQNPKTGVFKTGLYGFSWTTFFFSGFPALFRGDILVSVAVFILSLLTFGLAAFFWAFLYNKHYTLKLLERGYVFDDSEEKIRKACLKLGVAFPQPAAGKQA